MAGDSARGIARWAEDTQHAVADSVYGTLASRIGPVAEPVRLIQRGLTRHAYFWVQAGLAAATVAARVVCAARATDTGSIHDHPGAGRSVSVLNGFRGDHLHRHGSALALPMALRHAGRDVTLTPRGLRAAYGSGHGRLVVFVHGLVETEHSWRYKAAQRWGDPDTSYGSRLRDERGYLPIWVRYNTGLPIGANAAAFAHLLGALVDNWPEPLQEIVLVGHSMGGLVSLGALTDDRPWRDSIRTVVTLGSPREGAPLARHAAHAEAVARSVPPVRWLGHLLGQRSAGIDDLRHHDPAGPAVPARIGQYAVLSTLARTPTGLIGTLVGDGLVPVPGRHVVPTVVLGGIGHLDLLNHPRVYEQLTTWLEAA